MTIGQTLRALRGRRTQTQVARDLNITSSALSMYESDRRVPRDEVKMRIARYYGQTVDDIFFQTERTNSARKGG